MDAGLALAVEGSDPAQFPLVVDGSVGQWVLGWVLLWPRVLCFHSDRFAVCSLGWDFSLEMALLHPGIESRGVLTHGLLGVG